MGDYKVLVEAVGSHGCEREKGNGTTVIGCERPGCPDCITREYVRRLKRAGSMLKTAELTHWPGAPEQVQDNLLTGLRTGAFR